MDTSDQLPKVLLIGGDGGPSGVPRHILHLATALQSDAQITVASDVNLGGYDGLADVGASHITLPGLQSHLSAAHLWRGWRGLLRLLKTHSADLVWLHARLPVVMGRTALAIRLWRPKHRVAVTFHGLPFGAGHRPMANSVSRWIERVLLTVCPPLDLVFLSQYAADTMVKTIGHKRLGRHRIHVLPNCSDLGALPTKTHSDHRQLVMTGRVGWQKNYQRAAQILAHLPDHFQLTLCGAGTDEKAFQSDMAARLPKDVAARINYAGPVQDVRPYLMSADGYLLCSRYEGMPIGTLEAFEAGLPIILSDFEGADELAAKHPFALMLDFADMPKDAEKIENLINRYRASETTAHQEIRKVWDTEWSPKVFAENAKALVKDLIRA
ncbi:MAG: glycosyltransferase family 4 protein [Sulfitobacter sp.]